MPANRVPRWARSFTYHQAGRRPHLAPLTESPEPDEQVERRGRRLGYALAVLAPILVSLGLWVVRSRIDRSTAVLVLVIPVVLVAIIGGRGPAALAGIIAPVVFDLLLVEPYHQLRIHAAEDLEAGAVLLVVGLVVGRLVTSEKRNRVCSTSRGNSLTALQEMARAAAGPHAAERLTERAAVSLCTLLDLRECHWSPGYHGSAYPRLLRDGEILDGISRMPATGVLPVTGVELLVNAGPHEFGRMILVPADAAAISREDRLAALAIADILGTALACRTPS